MAETMPGVDLNLVPAMKAPPGETSNLKDPYNSDRFMYLTAGICLGFSTFAVFFRLFVKARILRAMQLEEAILIFSLAGLVSLTAVMIKSTLIGQGVHQWNVSMAHVMKITEFYLHLRTARENMEPICPRPLWFSTRFSYYDICVKSHVRYDHPVTSDGCDYATTVTNTK
ncbi:hypothetical protein Plec18167_007768 [Paecilomyces lecythidis]|uniref:Uncharacterized protein n=1 Tax=Paecilomyces lecythidis TaxID=3004212 RepID=A0ABR3X0P4_9EURO